MEIRKINPEESALALEVYNSFGYEWHPNNDDQVWICSDRDNHIGIVRICSEDSFLVLRGMFVHEDYQGQGIGTQMLKKLEPTLVDHITYCLPYAYLADYYGRIGFRHIPNEQAPEFLQERLVVYSRRFDKLIIMKREKGQRID